MIDGLEYHNDGFQKAEQTESNNNFNYGINGAWFVGSSRDYFSPFETHQMIGYNIYNSCGSFTLAVYKNK